MWNGPGGVEGGTCIYGDDGKKFAADFAKSGGEMEDMHGGWAKDYRVTAGKVKAMADTLENNENNNVRLAATLTSPFGDTSGGGGGDNPPMTRRSGSYEPIPAESATHRVLMPSAGTEPVPVESATRRALLSDAGTNPEYSWRS
ncbi:hypothetical protein LWC34_35575 [Kibdelosporangium philippinense]|uniref:Uncharacterized protein n=1 Tax=Kibdelosporangium philippinense TaxID=211113 RepID=A0ABS8ZK44_9PSEU|nr:hypothetical protein [Kibdelosporangium philippinense]MCE7008105.1 hypothetical protein [Kibdelosporangium philippinense]